MSMLLNRQRSYRVALSVRHPLCSLMSTSLSTEDNTSLQLMQHNFLLKPPLLDWPLVRVFCLDWRKMGSLLGSRPLTPNSLFSCLFQQRKTYSRHLLRIDSHFVCVCVHEVYVTRYELVCQCCDSSRTELRWRQSFQETGTWAGICQDIYEAVRSP